MDDRLIQVIKERREIEAALKATVDRSRQIAIDAITSSGIRANRPFLLLRMTEALIDAHVAAKIDGEGATLDYIEDALRHVGERLAAEHGQTSNFRQMTIQPR